MRRVLKQKKRIVVKVGTSSLSYPNGRLNFQRIANLAFILSALRNKELEIILVSSGAIGVGAGRIGMIEKPADLATKQALAAIGQAELIKIYQKFFEEYNQIVAQVLLTKDIVTIAERHENARNTLLNLLKMGIIPIINENDTISTYEIGYGGNFGDNDTLSANVATLVDADLLILLSDIDGLYSADPKKQKGAEIIHSVEAITPELEKLATGTGTSFGTGGMITKISAAKICLEAGIDTVITNGSDPSIIFSILEGKEIGTHFVARKDKVILNNYQA
ncbi:MAG: glutamate 5-kinase [Bacteroidales bacterium]|nr:glutamate 5-kinase [Bacteroidales bacterium]